MAQEGGAIYSANSDPTIEGCKFFANTAEKGGGAIYITLSPHTTIKDCEIIENEAQWGGGIFCYIASPDIINTLVSKNTAERGGGGIYALENAHPTIESCVFEENLAVVGGGVKCGSNSNPDIIASKFLANEAEFGGALSSKNSSPTIANSIFEGNEALKGGAIWCWSSLNIIFTNCTLNANSAKEGGAIFSGGTSNLVFRNSIIWGNTISDAPPEEGGGSQCYISTHSRITLHFCCYDNSAGHVAGGGKGALMYSDDTIHDDPQFEEEGLNLSEGSPCIDAGNNDFVDELGITEDIDGNPRIADGHADGTAKVDIGAYEYQP